MTRSVWKGPFVDMYLIKKAEKVQGLRTSMQCYLDQSEIHSRQAL